MVPTLEESVQLFYMISHNKPRITDEEEIILEIYGGKVFVEANYHLWKTAILDKPRRGYQQPERLAAAVILETTCTRGNERDYEQITRIQNGKFVMAVERLYNKSLEGLEPEERLEELRLESVTLLAKCFVHIFYKREIKEQVSPMRKQPDKPYSN